MWGWQRRRRAYNDGDSAGTKRVAGVVDDCEDLGLAAVDEGVGHAERTNVVGVNTQIGVDEQFHGRRRRQPRAGHQCMHRLARRAMATTPPSTVT